MKLKVNATTVTPLMQIEASETRRDKNGVKKLITTVKTRFVENENIGLVKIPIYTGNGFRGLLRRMMSEIILEEAIKKGIKINTSDYFLMVAGGGANYQKQDFDVVEKVRFLNPVISILGTSLAVPGKLIVTDLTPENYEEHLYEYKSRKNNEEVETAGIEDESEFNNENIGVIETAKYGCSLIQTRTFTKKDDILAQTKFGRFLSKEDISDWEKKISEEKNKNKEAGEGERLTIQSILSAEYIVPGTKFAGYILSKEALTDVECGLLLRGLTNLTGEYLGAGSSNGFGIANYNIYDKDGNEVISSLVDSDNLLRRTTTVTERDHEKGCIAKFNEWLSNLTEDNINVSGLMKSTEKKKAEKNTKKNKNQEAEV